MASQAGATSKTQALLSDLSKMWKAPEKWTEDQVHWNESARLAVRRALFFVRLIEPDQADDELLHALGRAHQQLESVGGPGGTGTAASGASQPMLSPMPSSVPTTSTYSGAYEPFDTLRECFEKLRTDILKLIERAEKRRQQGGASSAYDLVQPLDEDLCTFLKMSLPKDFAIRNAYVRVPALLTVVVQHAGFLLGLAFAVFVVTQVEAVRSLLLNLSPIWLAGIVVTTLLPVLIDVGWGRLRRRKGKTPGWDRGGRAFLSLNPVTKEPQNWVPRQLTAKEGRRIYYGILKKFGIYLGVWSAIGVVYWVLEQLTEGDGVGLTTYMIVVTIELLVLVGAAIDFVDIHSQAPFRRWMIWGMVLLMAAVFASDRTVVVVFVLLLWLAGTVALALRVRYQQIVFAVLALAVVVLVGVFTTVYHRWSDHWAYVKPESLTSISSIEWPFPGPAPVVVMAASGGGSRSAIYTGLTLDSLRASPGLASVAENLQAVSSVSGGSLANAAYLGSRLSALGVQGVPTCTHSITKRVSEDFLRPTLVGLVTLAGRAKGIERAWQRCPVGLGAATVDTVARVWRDAGGLTPPLPIPVFNSVTLDRHAVAISPFDPEMLRHEAVDESARRLTNVYDSLHSVGQPTWVYYRSGIYGHRDLVGAYDPLLSASVRASANFPFGFPLVEVRTPAPLWYGPRENARSDDDKIVQMTDGGALSNSGMWSLFPLLRNHAEDLKKRGVLLIVVDASGMPAYRSRNRQLRLIGTILDKNPKSELLHREMLGALQSAIGPCFVTVQLTLDPTDATNIHTTWTLDHKKETELERIFGRNWQGKSQKIRDAWRLLPDCLAGEEAAVEQLEALDESGGPRWPVS